MNVVGTNTVRSDGAAKLRGEAVYGVDVALPGMLHARLLRSPISAGRVVQLDVTPAREMPGVWSVITAEDAPDHRHGLVINDQRLFASDRVRFEGEPVAAVAAETRAAAQRAVAAIEVRSRTGVTGCGPRDRCGLRSAGWCTPSGPASIRLVRIFRAAPMSPEK